MAAQTPDTNARRVLAFNSLKRMIAVFQSETATAKAIGVSAVAVHYACSGQRLSCNGMYFRWLDDNIELEWEDLGNLLVTEYDELCGNKRDVYRTGNFAKERTTKKKIRKDASKNNQQIKE